jgi:hypothetical protein
MTLKINSTYSKEELEHRLDYLYTHQNKREQLRNTGTILTSRRTLHHRGYGTSDFTITQIEDFKLTLQRDKIPVINFVLFSMVLIFCITLAVLSNFNPWYILLCVITTLTTITCYLAGQITYIMRFITNYVNN